ncbi:O-antigen polymerase [Candidatus Vecturithrix granuli]|uniref:O-antigen polymerase n=1 Tax=Vecturithrix granuli TaxID=1499967 RepID=A0A081BY55_VECG1|nr:O-antigen polymerase [Candidatus Vecturithrix granuli]
MTLKIFASKTISDYLFVSVLALVAVVIFNRSPVLITLLTVGGVIIVFLFFKKPEYSVLFLAAILPFRDVHLFSVIYVKRIVIWGLFSYILLRQFTLPQHHPSKNMRFFTQATIFFIMMICVSLLKTASQLHTGFYMTIGTLKTTIIDHALTVVEQILIVYIVYDLIRSLQFVQWLFDVIITTSAIVAVLGLWQYVIGGTPDPVSFLFSPTLQFYGRATSVFLTPNSFGHFLATVIGIAFPLFLFGRISQKKRFFFLLPILLLDSIALFVSFSRGGMLSLFWGIIIATLLYHVKICQRKLTWRMFTFILMLVILVSLFISQYELFLRYRFASYSKGFDAAVVWLNTKSDADRKYAAIKAIETFLHNPLLGIGYDVYTNKNIAAGLGPDNQYLEILVNAGLLGFIPYMMMLAFVIKSGLRLWNKAYRDQIPFDIQIIMLCLLVGFNIICFSHLFAVTLYYRTISGNLWLFTGAIFVLERHYLSQGSFPERQALFSYTEDTPMT